MSVVGFRQLLLSSSQMVWEAGAFNDEGRDVANDRLLNRFDGETSMISMDHFLALTVRRRFIVFQIES